MPTEVIFPKVDMDMATGQISRWFYKEGDVIKKGEPLFEMETDKAAMEIDAPASGTLRNVTGVEGTDIAVGAPVAWIYAEGEAVDDAIASPDTAKPQVVGPDPDVELDARPADAGAVQALTETPPATTDAASCKPCADPEGERNGVRATPLARRIARERGIDLSSLRGRGPHGRIQREDVEEAKRAAPVSPKAPEAFMQSEAAPASVPSSSAAPTPARSTSTPNASPLHLVRLREGEGTPIVLVHGFGSESASWRPLLAELGEGGGPILGVDLAGHGGSLDAPAQGFDDLVAGVEEALVAEGISGCHLVGHSLGGAVAVAVASGIAVDVRSLLLVSPAGFGPDIDTGFVEGFAAARQEAPVRSWLRHLVADPASLSDGFVRATARARADGRHAEAQTKLAGALFSNGTQHFEVRSLLPHLAMPVALIAGADDRVVPIRHFAGLPGTIALHVFARTGHLPQIERRTEVARLLRRHVR
ncbi:acetoin dehydrogenase dihydrolipoyllysine-residue acetyltransferase subunit [Aureimonas sp. AU12]|uniref:acetoin dehydrogenase dihydrolipoyllysine-residue acetyltransferase subunit n=1 Tax=Aureimonas sp. AU12 TaxID=1638161 RepID=UPI0007852A9C|nr:acetoin dehydrogenase dihydrolipoyllysine-residue acetyltransferase subunit [Aureimonas sp. AU12]